MARQWISLLRSLGEALMEVLSAEAVTLREDIATSGRNLALAMALAGLAFVVLFWAVGTATFLVYQLLSLRLSNWLSALIVLGLLLLIAMAIAALARWRLQRLESPAATIRRRITDHQNWWQERILVEPDDAVVASLSEDESAEKPKITNE